MIPSSTSCVLLALRPRKKGAKVFAVRVAEKGLHVNQYDSVMPKQYKAEVGILISLAASRWVPEFSVPPEMVQRLHRAVGFQ